jgi:hypothetical protein
MSIADLSPGPQASNANLRSMSPAEPALHMVKVELLMVVRLS